MTDNTPPVDAAVIAHGYALMVPAPDGVDDVMARTIGAHQAAFDAALEPFGITLDDLLQATWMRIVRAGDVKAVPDLRGRTQEIGQALADGFASAPDPAAAGWTAPSEALLASASPSEAVADALNAAAVAGGGPVSLPLLSSPSDQCCNGDAVGARCSSVPLPAPDGVYVTDQLRDPESFGERIDLPADPETIAAREADRG